MRSFVALALTDEAVQALVRLQKRLGTGRPVPPENLHLTLAFLDDQTDETLEALHQELLRIHAAPFSVTLSGLGQFGRAVHLAVPDNPHLSVLHDKVRAAARRAGFTLPRRRFRPHVTILRMKPGFQLPPQSRDLAGFEYPDMAATRFSLYTSILHPKGARHECLAEYPLAPEG